MSRRLGYWAQRYATIFCIFLAILAYLWRENSQLIYPQILYLITLLLGLNLSAGVALRQWPTREWISALIICANNATITAIIAYSGGRESNLWVIYLLPISTACLLLQGREVAWITAGAISFNVVYFLLSVVNWDAAAYFELLLKSGIFVFSAAITYKVGHRERSLREALDQQALKMEQGQRLESIGRLAGGVAHDFNNLLTAILGYCQLLESTFEPGDNRIEDLHEITGASKRAAALTGQLLAFSRRQVLAPTVLNLNKTVSTMEKMLRRLIGEDLEFSVSLAPELGNIRADAGKLEQVVMNLAVNARDAMPTGGRISIETADVSFSEDSPGQHDVIPSGDYVMIAVSDTGCGMNSETLSHLFEPFFTTKEQGKGTGLGLSTVFGIVKQSGGFIRVHSEPGQGTAFKIYFPITSESIGPSRDARALPKTLRGAETILLAEDDASVRRLLARTLRQSGYAVLEACNGRDAIRIIEQRGEQIQLILTDIVMPDLGGRGLADYVNLVRPQTRIIFMSGYTDDVIIRHGKLDPGTIFLQKPITSEALLQKIRCTLEAPSMPERLIADKTGSDHSFPAPR